MPFFRAYFIGTCLNVAVSLFKRSVTTGNLKMFMYMYIRLIHTRGGMYIHVNWNRKFIVGMGSTLASHLRPFPRLRMSEAIFLRPLYAFMASTGFKFTLFYKGDKGYM